MPAQPFPIPADPDEPARPRLDNLVPSRPTRVAAPRDKTTRVRSSRAGGAGHRRTYVFRRS